MYFVARGDIIVLESNYIRSGRDESKRTYSRVIEIFTRARSKYAYEEKMKELYSGKAIGYKINWQGKTTFRELEEGEDADTIYFGENEIKGDTFSTNLILNKEELIASFKKISTKKGIEKGSVSITSYYLDNNNEIDTTLPYNGFKGYENINYLKEC